MLRSDLGCDALQTILAHETLHPTYRSQTPRVVSDCIRCTGRRGKWVGMLQDFSFKIVHRPGLKHMNVDALSMNLVGSATDDEDFGAEIQDIAGAQVDVPEGGEELLYALT